MKDQWAHLEYAKSFLMRAGNIKKELEHILFKPTLNLGRNDHIVVVVRRISVISKRKTPGESFGKGNMWLGDGGGKDWKPLLSIINQLTTNLCLEVIEQQRFWIVYFECRAAKAFWQPHPWFAL